VTVLQSNLRNLYLFALFALAFFGSGALCIAFAAVTPVLTQPVGLTSSVSSAPTVLDSILSNPATANAQLLDNIVNQASGTPIRTVPASGATAATEQYLSTSSSRWASAGTMLTIAGAAMSRFQPAVGSAVMGLGYLANFQFDLKKAYDSNWFQSDPVLLPVVSAAFPPGLVPGQVVEFSLGNNLQIVQQIGTGCNNYNYYVTNYGATDMQHLVWASPYSVLFKYTAYDPAQGCFPYTSYYVISTTEGLSPPSGVPVTLSDAQVDTLKNALINAIPNNSNIPTALDNIIKAHPETMAKPYPITNNAINNYTQNIVNNAYDNAVTTAQNNYNANPSEANAYALAEANAEAEKQKQPDETASTPDLTTPDKLLVNFDPLVGAGALLMTKFPFALVTPLTTAFSVLNVSPVAPNFEIDLGLAKKQISFDVFSSFSAAIRAILSFLLYLSTGWACVKLFARM
jgi:hypothetical protein